jgi:ketosteroid isomerase-like protein
MSQENVETVRKMWEASMEDDPADLDLSLLAEDVVYEDDVLPDHGGETYRGHAGILRAWARAIEPWEDSENVIEWARDAGEQVVSCHRVRGRGRASEIRVDFQYAYVWRFDGEKVVYVKSYRDPANALEAAGLSG